MTDVDPEQVTEHWHHIDNSSAVKGCGWAKGSGKMVGRGAEVVPGTLYVVYLKNGKVSGVYAYTTNDGTLCCRLAMADSPGQFAHRHLHQLPYARIK